MWEKKGPVVFNPLAPSLWGPSTAGYSICQDPFYPAPSYSGFWQLQPPLAPLGLEVKTGLPSPSLCILIIFL